SSLMRSFLFFFSSRRRHTRFSRDWSSDVCSSDLGPNYDGSEHEPLILPAKIPNLLINGSSGIAVGMATNIPPHNLNEVVDACLLLLDEPDSDISDLMACIPAPDFPTAGVIYGVAGIKETATASSLMNCLIK